MIVFIPVQRFFIIMGKKTLYLGAWGMILHNIDYRLFHKISEHLMDTLCTVVLNLITLFVTSLRPGQIDQSKPRSIEYGEQGVLSR